MPTVAMHGQRNIRMKVRVSQERCGRLVRGLQVSDSKLALEVRGLCVDFKIGNVYGRAVDNLSFILGEGQVLGILGESGSGKSAAMKGILRLHDHWRTRVSGESVTFDGENLLHADGRRMRKILGAEIAIIFQDAAASLNPAFTIGTQISEVLRVRKNMSKRIAKNRTLELLNEVGIPNPAGNYDLYPHEFSGGMCQRVAIASAIALQPRVLIADEPTTALDVTVQAQILELLQKLKEQYSMSTIIVSHDIALMSEFTDRLVVMYGGRLVEDGETSGVVREPSHPYTQGLLRSIPTAAGRGQRLIAIPGAPPTISARPAGCVFHPRCHLRDDTLLCNREQPEPHVTSAGRNCACHVVTKEGYGA